MRVPGQGAWVNYRPVSLLVNVKCSGCSG
uniref:Uncharacterized protein n=1 Tax=Anguilla anguilla TaxID=7936 RepID=A0A0E9WPC8_ANGAN